MKLRIFALMLCAALCLSLSGCGGANVPGSSGVSSSASSSKPMETVSFDDVAFQYDAQYSYDEENKSIVFEEGRAFVNILQLEKMSAILDSSSNYDNSWAKLQHEGIIDAILSGLGSDETVEPVQLEVAGLPAWRSRVALPASDGTLSYDLVTFEASSHFYGLAYASISHSASGEEEVGYDDAFEEILTSVTLL